VGHGPAWSEGHAGRASGKFSMVARRRGCPGQRGGWRGDTSEVPSRPNRVLLSAAGEEVGFAGHDATGVGHGPAWSEGHAGRASGKFSMVARRRGCPGQRGGWRGTRQRCPREVTRLGFSRSTS
jgi:hypothetical protein